MISYIQILSLISKNLKYSFSLIKPNSAPTINYCKLTWSIDIKFETLSIWVVNFSMPITKQHLRYEETGRCNSVASSGCNVVCCNSKYTVATATCLDVTLWDVKLGEKKIVLRGGEHVVTKINVMENTLVAGFADGMLRLYKLNEGAYEADVLLAGHKSAVTALAFSQDGLLLASGGKDSALILWDLVNESGKFRLIGHKGQVTQIIFCQNDQFLISSSKDSFIKIWDLSCQHSIWTITDHRTEVWDLCLVHDESCLITGSGEQEMRVYDLKWKHGQIESHEKMENKENEQTTDVLTCELVGSVLRSSKGRICEMSITKDQRLLACLGTTNTFDIFRVFTVEEMEIRKKKKVKKLKKQNNVDPGDENDEIWLKMVDSDLSVRIARIGEHRTENKAKIKSISPTPNSCFKNATFVCSLSTNILEVVEVKCDESKAETSGKLVLENCGHRTDMRCVIVSHDGGGILSVSEESLKLWSMNSLKCVRSMSVSAATSALFAPGDRHVLVGNKEGQIMLADISAGEVVKTYDAHSGAIWAMNLSPDMTMVATASGDKTVKLWNFELNNINERSTLTLRNTRTLELTEDALCVKFAPNGKTFTVGFLDNTAKVFFVDTFKLFLTLYGHSLPVLCVDVSFDNSLIVTGSADKNVKIWGLDFGDCHKSLFAHDDSVTAVQFVPGTHLFFSCGKDGIIKQWDAQKFERIQSLKGHAGEIWSLGLNDTGSTIVTCSHDKTLRVWERTEEIIVVHEEQEEERAQDYENALLENEDVIPGEISGESDLAAKKTMDSVRATELIIDCIQIVVQEKSELANDPKYEISHPLIHAMASKTLERFVMDTIKKIKHNDLEKALILVPFLEAMKLLSFLCDAIKTHYYSEQACKILLFLLRIHHSQLLSSSHNFGIIDQLAKIVPSSVQQNLDVFGFNLAALRLLQLELGERKSIQLFTDVFEEKEKKNKKKKRAFLLQT